jgi:O-antigen/teichoic acid export membrane protein
LTASSTAATFTSRVAVLFGTGIFTAAMGIFNGILLAGLLGPKGKGDYYLVILLPATIVVFAQLGLPQAFGFFAAQSRTRRIVTTAILLAAGLSAVALLITAQLMPWLRETIIRGPELGQIVLGLTIVPITLAATFINSIVVGRQAVRWNLAAALGTSFSATALLVVLVGFASTGVDGAIVTYLASNLVHFAILVAGAIAVTAIIGAGATRVRVRELLRYGLPLYPGQLTSFFSYRFDVMLIAWLLVDASTAIGYYSMAISMAGMAFFFPHAVSRLFFPHVAGASREDADRQLPVVARVTLLVTGLAALAIAPASIMLIIVVLPEFRPAIEPLLLLLPGLVALSVGEVTKGYLTGLGRTGTVSLVSLSTFALNAAINLALIPILGIVGAALASLVSYTATAVAYAAISARLSGNPLIRFWLPTIGDIRYTIATVGVIGRRVFRRSSASA